MMIRCKYKVNFERVFKLKWIYLIGFGSWQRTGCYAEFGSYFDGFTYQYNTFCAAILNCTELQKTFIELWDYFNCLEVFRVSEKESLDHIWGRILHSSNLNVYPDSSFISLLILFQGQYSGVFRNLLDILKLRNLGIFFQNFSENW